MLLSENLRPAGFILSSRTKVFPKGRLFPKLLASAILVCGTPAGLFAQVEVELIKDIHPGEPGAFFPFTFSDAREHGGLLYFKANDGEHGEEPWISDGTAEGTAMLKDINPGSGTVSANSFTPFSDLVFFQADDGEHGRELWTTDGTETGTSLFLDINEGGGHGSPSHFFPFGGKLYFSANDGVHGQELWVSDGTAGGTYMLKDIRPGGLTSSSSPAGFAAYNGKLYFRANDGEHGQELWVSDGTEAGTHMVKDINEGNQTSDSAPNRFNVLNGELVFMADDGVHGFELWKTDGTEAGTVMIKDVHPGPAGLLVANFVAAPDPFVFGEKMFFGGIQEDFIYRLWETDGTEEGTKLFALPDGSDWVWARDFTLFDGDVFFAGGNDEVGDELWRTDGTPDGTTLVKDINPGPGLAEVGNMTPFNGLLYFTATDGTNGSELWHTDGNEAGTTKLSPPFLTQTNPVSMIGKQFREVGGRLLFPARYEDLGLELYGVVDATFGTAGTSAPDIKLFPNPARDAVTLDLGGQRARGLAVFNSTGRLILQQSAQPFEHLRIDVSGWPAGVYLICVDTESGRQTKRMVKM